MKFEKWEEKGIEGIVEGGVFRRACKEDKKERIRKKKKSNKKWWFLEMDDFVYSDANDHKINCAWRKQEYE